MLEEEYKSKFEKIYQAAGEAHMDFYTWKGMQNPEFNETYKHFPSFWKATMHALENCWLNALAKLYEDSKYSRSGQVISIFGLLPHHPDAERKLKIESSLEEHKDLIQNIDKLRDHQLAHNNAKHLLNPEKLLQKFPIKYAEVENLLKMTCELLNLFNWETGHHYEFKMLNEDSERASQEIIKTVQFFIEERKKYLDRFVKGEVDSPHFPPKE